MKQEPEEESQASCLELIKHIFTNYEAFYSTLVPRGWKASEFVYFFHPTSEQQLKAAQQMQERLDSLRKIKDQNAKVDEKTYSLADFPADDLSQVDETTEFPRILGLAVYDIFSNNHTVLSATGKAFVLGTMRGSGRFLAEFFNMNLMEVGEPLDYLDFYMGTTLIEDRANLLPFHQYIFTKLKAQNCEWEYAFPRLYLFKPAKGLTSDSPVNYDPVQAQLNTLKEQEEFSKMKAFQEELDALYEETRETAKYLPPPKIVQAYRTVYGKWPEGFDIIG